jgi:hypothetical protein
MEYSLALVPVVIGFPMFLWNTLERWDRGVATMYVFDESAPLVDSTVDLVATVESANEMNALVKAPRCYTYIAT